MSNFNNVMNAFNAIADSGAASSGASSSGTQEPVIDNIVCSICDSGDNEDTLLLCDGCPAAMHVECLNMAMVPPSDWYCAKCRRAGAGTTSRAPKKGDYVYLYERVSSKGQNAPEHGRVGMDTQNHVLMRFCFERNMTVRATYTDVGSGRDPTNLRDFRRMTARMPAGTCVMVYSVSRFGRDLAQVREYLNVLHAKGCYVYSVTENCSSFDEQFLNLVRESQRESDQLSVTMRESVARRRREGHWIGPAPYGFEVFRDANNRRRVRPLAAEAQGLAVLVGDGNGNTNDRLKELERRNIHPRTGVWTYSRVESAHKRAWDAINQPE